MAKQDPKVLADAIEILAIRYADLQKENENIKRNHRYAMQELDFYGQENGRLKTQIVRLKNKLAKQNLNPAE